MDKSRFRKLFLQRLQKSSQISKLYKDKQVAQKVELIIKMLKPKSILFYQPLKIEPNLNPLLIKYKRKIKILTPFMEGVSFKMVKYRLPLKRKRFGILESPNSLFIQKKVDLIIVPVIGVDGNLKRVGFGKGMYDRFFETLSCKPIVVFVQIEECFTKEKICNDLDIQAHYYVTPKKIIFRGGQHDNRASCWSGCSNFRWHSSFFYGK